MTNGKENLFLLWLQLTKLHKKQMHVRNVTLKTKNKNGNHILDMSWNWDKNKIYKISEIQSDITHLEWVDWRNRRDINHINLLSLWFFSVWTRPDRSHTVLTSTSREMTFKFQTVKKNLTKNFSLCFFLLLKNCTRLLQKSIISYTYLYDNIVYGILL